MIDRCDPSITCCGPADDPKPPADEPAAPAADEGPAPGAPSTFERGEPPDKELARRTTGLSPEAVGTIEFLERLPGPVAPGVRYPLLTQDEMREVERHHRHLDRPFVPIENFTQFGRHQGEMLAIREAIADGTIKGPIRLLIVGVEFEIDVVDPNQEVSSFFAHLATQKAFSFVVGDNLFPQGNVRQVDPLYVRQLFGSLAQDVTWDIGNRLPPGATRAYRIILSQEILRRIHFFRRSVLGPLPRTGYGLADYQNVWTYLPESLWRRGTGREAVDVANLFLNVAPRAWLNTDIMYRDPYDAMAMIARSSPSLDIIQSPPPTVVRLRPYLEKQPNGSWRLVLPWSPRDGGEGGGGVSYRGAGPTGGAEPSTAPVEREDGPLLGPEGAVRGGWLLTPPAVDGVEGPSRLLELAPAERPILVP